MAEDRIRIMGLMSGSSLDGIDVAIVEFTGSKADSDELNTPGWQLLYTQTVPYPGDLVKKLAGATSLSSQELFALDAELGSYTGRLCQKHIRSAGIVPDFIASHGHTIFHSPARGFTVQIGSAAQIARETGLPVIADFRSADIAAGGQGAPLAPVVEKYLFTEHKTFLNLGGIANLSVHGDHEIRAWDICPCNQLLNYTSRTKGLEMDRDGKLAAKGEVIPELLHDLSSVVRLPLTQPVSLDNSFVGGSYLPLIDKYAVSAESKLRTIIEYISSSVSTQIREFSGHFPPESTMLVTGGGAHNKFLVEILKEKMAAPDVEPVIPSSTIIDFKEALLIAFCGYLRLNGIPNSLSSVTGAALDTINGCISLPPGSGKQD